MQTPILLATLNATYQHCAFGLRYLYANLGELMPQAQILEFTLDQNPRDVVEQMLALSPKLIGLGVYIWNVRQTTDLVRILTRVAPDCLVVVGGPEVSHELENQPLAEIADVVVRGEADFVFPQLCRNFLTKGELPAQKWVAGEIPSTGAIKSPYPYYSDGDIKNRLIYVEASRGCPYRCEFCLSSLDKSVRAFPLESFLNDMDALIGRGARHFKFVDRTFNLSPATSGRILQFFLDRVSRGLFLHFEMVPDRLPIELREKIRQFPAGSLQFEIGIQTWSPEVAKNVSRRQDYSKIEDNFRFLSRETGAHLHADLIAGLPGENWDTFAEGFDRLAALAPQEIQVGILKRLKGTPITRHDREYEMVYDEAPPFALLKNRDMGFAAMQSLTRFAKFWDLVANRGQFPQAMDLLRKLAGSRLRPSLFAEMHELSEFLATRHPQRHSIALQNLTHSLWLYLTERRGLPSDLVRPALIQDYTGYVKRDVPAFLRDDANGPAAGANRRAQIKRQRRHLAQVVT